jgi:hypothetical protein
MSASRSARTVGAIVLLVVASALSPAAVTANEPPYARVAGPTYVPASSVSPRIFDAQAFDLDSASSTPSFACGSQPSVDSGPGLINGHFWFRCSFAGQGTQLVGVRVQDTEGATSSALMEVVATTRVRSVADGRVVATGHTADRSFGGSIALVDLNGDGKSEMASGVGRPRSSPQETGVRDVHVLFGRSAGGGVDDSQYTGATGFRISGTADELRFGISIAGAGDMNHDGYRDLVIASPSSGSGTDGRAYVVLGRANISSLTPATMTASQGFRITAPGAGANINVAGGGDVNGDGYSDVVVGTAAATYVVLGKSKPVNVNLGDNPSTFGARLTGSTANQNVGQALALGDVNGDKKMDVIVGTSDYPGNVRVVFGRSNFGGVINLATMVSSVGFTVSGTGQLVRSVLAAGDVNGDGKAEILASSASPLDQSDTRSRVSVILGQTAPTSFALNSDTQSRAFEIVLPRGETVAALAAPDWNGDKKADVLIGAPGADQARGSTYIVPGQAHVTNIKLEVLGSWTRIDGDLPGASAGEALAAGDFNGDKRPDVAVGAPWTITEDPDPFRFGRVGVFLGTGPVPDSTPPVATPPSPYLFSSAHLTANPTVRISWAAGTDNVGITRYRLQRKLNAGTWNDVALSSPTTLSADVNMTAGSNHYTFRVRAIDAAGNVSTWKTGPTFQVGMVQENSSAISYAGLFSLDAVAGSSGGNVRWSRTAADSATLTFTGRSVAFVTDLGTRGKLRISVDGERLSEIDLYAYAPFPAWIPVAYNLTSGTHTVTVNVLGTSNGASGEPRIDIDAFVVLR